MQIAMELLDPVITFVYLEQFETEYICKLGLYSVNVARFCKAICLFESIYSECRM